MFAFYSSLVSLVVMFSVCKINKKNGTPKKMTALFSLFVKNSR